MTGSNEHPTSQVTAARRLTLLGSAAVLGSAVVLAGPLGYGRFGESALAATPAAQSQQGPSQQGPSQQGLTTDLPISSAKVKPAVISVRVQRRPERRSRRCRASDERADNPRLQRARRSRNSSGAWLRGNGRREMQRHQIITGVGSGFFISADGYAVTNNHVVDHAKSVAGHDR